MTRSKVIVTHIRQKLADTPPNKEFGMPPCDRVRPAGEIPQNTNSENAERFDPKKDLVGKTRCDNSLGTRGHIAVAERPLPQKTHIHPIFRDCFEG